MPKGKVQNLEGIRFVKYEADGETVIELLNPISDKIGLIKELSNSLAERVQELSCWWVLVPRKRYKMAKMKKRIDELDRARQDELARLLREIS